MKKINSLLLALSLGLSLGVSAKPMGGRTDGYRSSGASLDTVMFQYDLITDTNLNSKPTFIITPHAKAHNYLMDLPLVGPAIAFLGYPIAAMNAKLQEEENFVDASIVDKEGNLVCKASSSKVEAFDQSFVDKYENIIGRGDYKLKKYPEWAKAALVSFNKSCFATENKIKLEVRSEGEYHNGEKLRIETVDTLPNSMKELIISKF